MAAWITPVLRGLAISTAIGVVFAFMGVYGTNELPLGLRLGYWCGLMALGFASATIITPWVFDGVLAGRPAWLQIAVAAGLIALPVTAGLLLIDAADGSIPPPSLWPVQYFYALAVTLILTVGGWAADRLRDAQPAAAPPEAPRQPPATPPSAPGGAPPTSANTPAAMPPGFGERLPIRLRSATLYAVSAEDHYLRVHTSAGEELILLRLGDAMRELASLDGLQTHRSWWVARQGLAETGREDGKLVLKLKSGVAAPVSRTYAAAVRAAGWI